MTNLELRVDAVSGRQSAAAGPWHGYRGQLCLDRGMGRLYIPYMEAVAKTKRCCRCGRPKSVEEFSFDRIRKDGRQSMCKACKAAHYAANRERIAECGRRYRATNREKISEYQREHYAANRERIIERHREYDNSQRGGVYKLTCVPTGDVYFGSAGNFQKRRSVHFSHLRTCDHENPTIRKLSKIHSPNDFEFQILIICDREEALHYEQLLIEMKPCCNVYNAKV